MRAVVQRVSHATVRVDGEVVGRVGYGMLILLGVLQGDGKAEARRLAQKIAMFRFFEDENGRMNLSAIDLKLGALVVSQFTLAADGRKGRRPSFDRAAPPEVARLLYEFFTDCLREWGVACETGVFGARMQVELENQGPVTFTLEEEPTGSSAPAP